MKRKLSLVIALILVAVLAFSACGQKNAGGGAGGGDVSSVLVAGADETYYMVPFAADAPYWIDCFNGMTDALSLYGAKTVFQGTSGFDVADQTTIIEQLITKQAAGIAIAAANAEGIVPVIEKAWAAGIPVVNFDAAAASGTYGFIGTGNYAAGAAAAHEMAKLLNGTGKLGVVTVIDTDSTRNRGQGFIDTVASDYPGMEVVQVVDGKFDQAIAADATSAMLQNHPDIVGLFANFAAGGVGVCTAISENGKTGQIKVISFDTDPGTLDLIKSGDIVGTMAQGTWVMGWQSGQQLYWLQHDMLHPKPNWKEKGVSPLPNNIDTGITFVTKDNVDTFYAAE